MTKRKNPFERVKQYYADDGQDIHWWIDEEDLESFKRDWLDDTSWEEVHDGTTRELNGKEWNEWIVTHVIFGDHEGHFMDEDCPDCGSFLVRPTSQDDGIYTSNRFCSTCDYVNDDYQAESDKKEAEWKEMRNKPPEPKFRVEGESLEDFCERTKVDLERHEDKYCTVCKQKVDVSDYYQIKGYAVVTFGKGHAEDCKNKHCPSVGVPQGKEAEKWIEILGG